MPDPIELAIDVTRDPVTAVRRRGTRDEAGAPLLIDTPRGAALPIWSSVDAAHAFLDAAGPLEDRADRAELEIVVAEADDLRAKEELLQDARALGAVRVLHDPAPSPERGPAGYDRLERALLELVAERRASACL